MYKFEIHRNPNISTNGAFVDADRYNESGYILERTISPVWDDLVFEWKKDGDRAFFRKNLKGRLTLVDADFDWINGIRIDATERNKYRILIVYEKADGVWIEQWRGFFSIIVGEWNLSQCFASFSDLIVWDGYTEYLENMEEEKNLMDVGSFPINYDVTPYESDETEVIIATSTYNLIDPCTTGLPPLSASEFFLDELCAGDDCGFILSERLISVTYYNGYLSWVVRGIYRRDYVVQVNDPGTGWHDMGVSPVGSGNETHKWVRNYLGIASPTYTSRPALFGDCWDDNWFLVISSAPGFSNYTNNRARYFPSVISHAINSVPNPYISATYWGFSSDFLSNTINPVTGEASEVDRMFIIQFTDVLETSDPATKALYSFKNLEEWLLMLNLFWYIADDGTIWIEHKKYFDNGLSYTGAVIGLNVVDNVEAKATSVFSYKSKNLPRIQELNMFYTSGDDFYGSPILYTGNMANWGDENKYVRSTSDMATDLGGAVLNADAGKDGFMLVATELTSVAVYTVISGAGALTGSIIVNAPLSTANIEDKFYRWGGFSAIGVMNKEYTEFDSVENNFEQEVFTVTFKPESCCCGSSNAFNPYELVRTNYGDGKVEAATLAFKDKKLTLSLSYGT